MAITADRALSSFERDVLLTTGRAVRVRPAGSSDVGRLRDFYGQLSDASNYSRFFGIRRFIPEQELHRATVQNVRAHVTLIAQAGDDLIGVGEYHAMPNGDEAEVAFAVSDVHQHEGIATVLLEDLAMIARSAGFSRLVASTMPENTAMRRVFRTVGLLTRDWFSDGLVHVQLDLTTAHLMEDDADLREWRSTVQSLQPIVQPSHVVVIGAGRDELGPGRRILAHLRESFAGRISVVHPSGAEIGGIQSVSRISDLGTVPDLAVIAVPATAVVDVVKECGQTGIAAAVVISSGFAEQDDDGRRRQEELLAVARSHGMRIVGPNCLGIVSTRCGLNATFTAQRFLPGGIAVAAQSGGVGITIAAEAEQRRAGISAFVSMGNKVDVSSNDLLRLWADDDDTNVALLYLESFGDPVRFARVARAVSRRMPIVALKAGRTAPGRRAAGSHTAAL
ncbi:MAG TPA: GNAT family N-acetyltransferase, partial [Ilumatobacter sp.]